MRDVGKAIEFCKENDDEELWVLLVTFAVEDAEFVQELLKNIGTHVDPSILITRIKGGMRIDGLRDALVKILHDYKLQVGNYCHFFIGNSQLSSFRRSRY